MHGVEAGSTQQKTQMLTESEVLLGSVYNELKKELVLCHQGKKHRRGYVLHKK